MKGFIVRLFLRDNYPPCDLETMQKQLNWAHAINRWQRFQLKLMGFGLLFAIEPQLERLKVWLWHLLFTVN